VLGSALSASSAPIRRRRSSAYRAGPSLEDALRSSRRLAAHGLASTIGYAAAPHEDARTVASAHIAALDKLAAEEADCYVSVKLSGLDFDDSLFAEIAASASRSRRRLHLDALAPETADATWRLLAQTGGGDSLGTTLPGRWRRSAADAARAAELGLAVRVVKGQWPDANGDGLDPRRGFLEVVDRLRGHPAVVAVATHDVPLLAESLRRLVASGARGEVELFYGLPFRGPALVARCAGVPIRMYVPYGQTGAPYTTAGLATTPAAAWWLVQDLLFGEDKTWRSIRRTPLRI
jgi:proline dehydrogenase